MAVLAYVFALMLPYLPTLCQLPSQEMLSISCSLQTVIFTRMPKGHTGTAPISQSKTSLLFRPSGTQHLSGRNVMMLFSPTRTNIAVHAHCRFPPSLTALGLTRSPLHQLESFLMTTQSTSLRLGLPVCQPHRCRCCTQIDKLSQHPLSCHCSLGRCLIIMP